MNRTIEATLVTFAAVLALFACGGADETHVAAPDTRVTSTGAQVGADKAIVDQLASARCDQEQSCKNIGPGAKFASRDVCTDQLRGAIGNDLNTYQCPGGLDHAALDRCMSAIKTEECNHPFDTIKRFDKCSTGSLCLK